MIKVDKTEEMDFTNELNKVFKLKKENRFDEAIFVLKSLFDKMPNDFTIFALAGNIFFIQNKYEEALAHFEKVLKLKPKSEKASAEIFHCLNGLGRGDDALKEMSRFLNSVDELKKDNYKWILEDLLNDINNPHLAKYRNSILHFKNKFNLDF